MGEHQNWLTTLNIQFVAKLIMQDFCIVKQVDHTLTEMFAQTPFRYSSIVCSDPLPSDEEELSTYMAYKELTTDYQRSRRITPTQHLDLSAVLEKRLPKGGRIQADYFESKRSDNISQ